MCVTSFLYIHVAAPLRAAKMQCQFSKTPRYAEMQIQYVLLLCHKLFRAFVVLRSRLLVSPPQTANARPATTQAAAPILATLERLAAPVYGATDELDVEEATWL